jgi:hypothetical protein
MSLSEPEEALSASRLIKAIAIGVVVAAAGILIARSQRTSASKVSQRPA